MPLELDPNWRHEVGRYLDRAVPLAILVGALVWLMWGL